MTNAEERCLPSAQKAVPTTNRSTAHNSGARAAHGFIIEHRQMLNTAPRPSLYIKGFNLNALDADIYKFHLTPERDMVVRATKTCLVGVINKSCHAGLVSSICVCMCMSKRSSHNRRV